LIGVDSNTLIQALLIAIISFSAAMAASRMASA